MPTSKSLRKESDAVCIRSFGMVVVGSTPGKRAIPTAVAAQLAQHLSDRRLTARETQYYNELPAQKLLSAFGSGYWPSEIIEASLPIQFHCSPFVTTIGQSTH
jgi:hypothetical protein